MPLSIVRDDIVRRPVDAVVNAANTQLRAGGGVCGAVFAAAGHEKLQAACDKIGFCPTGSAVITPGFDLEARYIIHAVGPIWQGGSQSEVELLRSAYRASLELAIENGCDSIAFPLISSGIFGVPKDIALAAARDSFAAFLADHDILIELVLFDRSALEMSRALEARIRSYIDDHYVEENRFSYNRDEELRNLMALEGSFTSAPGAPLPAQAAAPKKAGHAKKHSGNLASAALATRRKRDLEDLVDSADETFTEMLLRLIDDRGLTDPQVYRRANMSRKLFSKIRSDAHYSPRKQTVVSLAVALELSLDETCDLLAAAGYAFAPSSVADIIVRFFIEQGDYDIFTINEALFAYDQRLLCE